MKTMKRDPNLEGKVFKDQFEVFIFCLGDVEIVSEFMKNFENFYTEFINLHDNPVDLQLFTNDDPKKLIYYSSDTGTGFEHFKSDEFPVGWGIVNEHGVHINSMNVYLLIKSSLVKLILINFHGRLINRLNAWVILNIKNLAFQKIKSTYILTNHAV